jgi:hypothetical protein
MAVNRVLFQEKIPADSSVFSPTHSTNPFNVLKNDIVVSCISFWYLADVPTYDFEYLDGGVYYPITKSIDYKLTGRLHLVAGMFVAPNDINGCVIRANNTIKPVSRATGWSSNVVVYRPVGNSTLVSNQTLIGTASFATNMNNITPINTTGPSKILLFNRTYNIQTNPPPTINNSYSALSTVNQFDCVYEKVSSSAISNESPVIGFSDFLYSVTAGFVFYEQGGVLQSDQTIAKGIARGIERGIV